MLFDDEPHYHLDYTESDCEEIRSDVLPLPDPEEDDADDADFDTGDEPSEGWTDAQADADALASAGWGTDEDYGCFDSCDSF